MKKPTPQSQTTVLSVRNFALEKLAEELVTIFIVAVFGVIFMVAAAIVILSSPIALPAAGISGAMIWAGVKGKLFQEDEDE